MKTCKMCGGTAAVYVVDLIGGVPIEHYLCNTCAANMNISPQNFQIANIFKELVGSLGAMQTIKPKPIEDIKCGNCGMTYSQFKKLLRFGCAHDYDLFNVASILEQICGASQHVGKTPNDIPWDPGADEETPPAPPPKDYIAIRAELQRKLDTAVAAEDYESAAKLRDEIKTLPKSE